MIVTGHWSATGPSRLNDYHVEFALKSPLTQSAHNAFLQAIGVDGATIKALFNVWKNQPLSTPTDYGTWHLNHDPRDQSADIEIGALCMAKATTDDFGDCPFTIAHAWMMAHIWARVATLKNIDLSGTVPITDDPNVLQNAPVYNFATHAERAIQTYNPAGATDEEHARKYGYFLNSGDPDLRWDLTILDPSDIPTLRAALQKDDARSLATESGTWIRTRAKAIQTAGISDFFGLDR